METDKRSRDALLAEAEKARRDARRLRLAAPMMHDDAIEELMYRHAGELEALAERLEAQAAETRGEEESEPE